MKSQSAAPADPTTTALCRPRDHLAESAVIGGSRVPTVASWSWTLALLFVSILAGRFTLSRWGAGASTIEVRAPLYACLFIAFLNWRMIARREYPSSWSTPLKLLMVHLLVLGISAFWAAPGAEIAMALVDLLCLGAVVAIAFTMARQNSRLWADQTIVMLYMTGILYAVLGVTLGSFGGQGRLSALGGGPNVYVRIVFMGVLAGIVLSIQRQNKAYLTPVPLLIYAAILSGSRGGIIAALATGLCALLYYGRHLRMRQLIFGSLAIVGLLYVVAEVLQDRLPWLENRYSTTELARQGYSGRPALIEKALDIYEEHPIFGSGIDSFAATYAPGQSGQYAHNYVASVAADTGTVGLLALVMILVAVVVASFRLLRVATPSQAGLLFASLFVFIAANSSGDYYDSRFGWVFAAIALAAPEARERVTKKMEGL